MAFDAHANLAVSLVATAPSPATSGTSLVVTAGEGSRFPATPFNATVCPANTLPDPSNAEIVRVTAISTDTFTITRAQESTSARSIVVGDLILAGDTKKTFTDIEGTTLHGWSANANDGDIDLNSHALTGAADVAVSGLTGATAASRYVGATASGAPASGTFSVGDFIIDQTGKVYVCTTAGSPGTWTETGGGGGSSLDLYVSGAHYGPSNVTSYGTGAPNLNQMNAWPQMIVATSAVSFSAISVNVTTAAASSVIRLGAYDSTGSNGGPGALLYDLGTVDSSSTGTKTITTSFSLGPGIVWIVAVSQGGTPTVQKISGTGVSDLGFWATSSNLSTNFQFNAYQGSVSGALPSSFTIAGIANAVMPLYMLTVA